MWQNKYLLSLHSVATFSYFSIRQPFY